MEKLRYYLAHNRGLQILDANGSLQPVGTFFEGRTLEHLTGSKTQPEVVFAAVAYDGGYRTRDAGKNLGESPRRRRADVHHRPPRRAGRVRGDRAGAALPQ